MTRTVVLDSDAMIKLGKAGLLSAAVQAWRCVVPEEVIHRDGGARTAGSPPGRRGDRGAVRSGVDTPASPPQTVGPSAGPGGLVRESGQRPHCSCRCTRISW